MAESTSSATLQAQLSGYGSRLVQIQEVLDRMGVKEPSEMEKWCVRLLLCGLTTSCAHPSLYRDSKRVHELVDMFMKVRFPTIYVLNKIDSPGADANVLRICDKYGDVRTLALSSPPNLITLLTACVMSCRLAGSHHFGECAGRVLPEEDAKG